MYALFMYCSSLKELNLSSFDISSLTSISGIFSNTESLQKLDIRKMDFTNVSKYEGSGTLTNIQIVNS